MLVFVRLPPLPPFARSAPAPANVAAFTRIVPPEPPPPVPPRVCAVASSPLAESAPSTVTAPPAMSHTTPPPAPPAVFLPLPPLAPASAGRSAPSK
ncbi:MAG: hypothetical protein H6745_01015 [Deltaproteobacteria bacterium]|nr:hypothetical protein [Deltaproteobacteria bacterium]